MPSSHTSPANTNCSRNDPLVDTELACAQFEATHAASSGTQTAAAMEAYRGLSARVTQAIDQWSNQYETYKMMLEAEAPSTSLCHSNVDGTDTRSVAELLTTVNELAAQLDQEIGDIASSTGSLDTAMALWKQYDTASVVLQTRLEASLRKVA